MSSNIFNLVADEEYASLKELLVSGGNSNEIYNDKSYEHDVGITPIYLAVLSGNVEILKLLIEHGANVNYAIPDEYVSQDVYAENPLSLALQARFLMSKEKYGPIVKLLEENGAIDET